MLGPRGWEVAHERAGDTDHSVDDGNVEAPPPCDVVGEGAADERADDG